ENSRVASNRCRRARVRRAQPKERRPIRQGTERSVREKGRCHPRSRPRCARSGKHGGPGGIADGIRCGLAGQFAYPAEKRQKRRTSPYRGAAFALDRPAITTPLKLANRDRRSLKVRPTEYSSGKRRG